MHALKTIDKQTYLGRLKDQGDRISSAEAIRFLRLCEHRVICSL